MEVNKMNENHFDRPIRADEETLLQSLLDKKKKRKKTKDILKLRCGIYARKSKKDISNISLEGQISYCKKMIATSELLEVTKIYQEDDVSGMFDDRKEFQKMISDIKNQAIDIVVCYSWDRFSRSMADVQRYYVQIIKLEGYIISGNSVMIIDSPQSLLFQQILWTQNEFQARQTAKNVMERFIEKIENTDKYLTRSRTIWL